MTTEVVRKNRKAFANSFVELALTRNGYDVQEVPVPTTAIEQFDLLVRSKGKAKPFGVEIKWAKDRGGIQRFVREFKSHTKAAVPVYQVIVVGDGSSLVVSPGLKRKLLVEKDEVTVESSSDFGSG